MTDLLKEPALYAGEIDENLDLSLPATSGEEYIKQVILEARKCESVVVAEINEARLKKPTINLAGCTEAPASFAPSLEWQECQVADFSKTRLYIARIRDEIQTSKRKWKPPPVDFPNMEDQKGWINLCCGSPDTEYKALPPTLDVILALNQPTIENVLEYLVNFIEEQGIIQFALGRWIYVLLVALELPLNPDMCSCLRSLARACSVIRANVINPDEYRVASLNLFICLVARYFRQLDLADQ
ncbi:gem-associated protein 2 isoform X2 [Belonocnema kinseyi]|uniref:gem-associated protein 2 isoform X2 n=1 Tax=Belonocnema kinseyi TaxID=2817044 RepID=UPI00143D4BA4|nr:gem-associated protein 2 isoform X2 [Belonocnema kinseyi]